jgi:hypothetical protein
MGFHWRDIDQGFGQFAQMFTVPQISAVSTNLRLMRFSEWGMPTSNLTAAVRFGGAGASTTRGLTASRSEI